MKLTVVAATGGIGRQVLEQAVAAGHDVTAVVRNPDKLSSTSARIVTAHLAASDPAALRPAVEGADAVLSGLGAHSKAEAGVAGQGTRAAGRVWRQRRRPADVARKARRSTVARVRPRHAADDTDGRGDCRGRQSARQ
jgi:uncharacterized protein YbjT (DUF2867 family)